MSECIQVKLNGDRAEFVALRDAWLDSSSSSELFLGSNNCFVPSRRSEVTWLGKVVKICLAVFLRYTVKEYFERHCVEFPYSW